MNDQKNKKVSHTPSGEGGKTLLLIRHAKSDWGDPSLSDFDRPLNERGKRDAPVMAHRLLDKKIFIDAFISSPANRARRTARIFAREFKKDKDDIILRDELYGASENVFFDVILTADNKFNSIAIFSHNPGLTDFANILTTTRVNNIPTSGIFAIKARCEKWKNFKETEKEFWFFDFPKAEG